MANRKFRKKSSGKGSAKPFTKEQDKGIVDQGKTNSMNDVAWYTRYPSLTAASASIPYPWRPGMQMPLAQAYYSDQTLYNIPGILRIKWLPAIGTSSSSTDPASLVARELYTRVRACFSGNLEADAPDFLIYLVCLDGIFSYIGMLKRLYRAISAYNPDNYSTPDVLLAALGVTDSGDRLTLTQNKVKLWQCINELVYMSRKFRCPGEFDIFNRHYWLNDHVYTDAPSVNSQLYIFWQEDFYKYETIDTPAGVPAAGAKLVTVNWSHPDSEIVDYLFQFGKDLIDALSYWDDCYTINGYLERAFADSRYFVVDELEQNAGLDLSYEPEVLMQIENLRSCDAGPNNAAARKVIGTDISQDPVTNSVIYEPQLKQMLDEFWYTNGAVYRLPVFSIRQEQPTLVDTIVASRMSVAFGPRAGGDETHAYFPIVCGTEIPIGIRVFYRNPNRATGFSYSDISQEKKDTAEISSVLNVAAFDWHPQVYAWSGTTASNDVKTVPVFDVHNITTCSVDQLRNIHRVCVLSEWNAFSV